MSPVTKKEAERLGARWYEFPKVEQTGEDAALIPVLLSEVDDSITGRRFRCPETGRSFFFTARQIALHKELGVALPRVHPIVNRNRRAISSLAIRLYRHACDSCGKQIETRIPPTFTAPVFCGTCYEKIVIGDMAPPTDKQS